MIKTDRRTKIVCTIGPSSNTREMLLKLAKTGMNMARLNFSHGTHDVHKANIDMIRSVSEEVGYDIPILADLQGPKIRVGSKLQNGALELEPGQILRLTSEDVEGGDGLVPIDYAHLADDVEVGNTILMDDGLLELRIVKKDGADIEASVVVGGLLKPRKGVNLPDVKTSVDSITEKDYADLDFALDQGVDFVALSFVRTAWDVQKLASKMRAKGSNAGIIAKIEKPEALDFIDDIIAESDGIMVARGDLGIEIPGERVPLVQKDIIKRCLKAGKAVITATQMLDSMIGNPRATRAENSDVANAVLDGTDAVMLSGETAAGKYPIEAVTTMAKICRSVEQNTKSIYQSLSFKKPEWKQKQVVESVSYSCVKMSEFVDAKLIAVITHSGSTARRISKYRPGVPVIAFTESMDVLRQLNLVWGVSAVKLEQVFNTDKSVMMIENYLKENRLANRGDRVIIATGMPLTSRGRTNMIKVSEIE